MTSRASVVDDVVAVLAIAAALCVLAINTVDFDIITFTSSVLILVVYPFAFLEEWRQKARN